MLPTILGSYYINAPLSGVLQLSCANLSVYRLWLQEDTQLLEGSHHHFPYHHDYIATIIIIIIILTIMSIIIITIIFSNADAGATNAAEIYINLEDIKVRKQINCRRNAPSLP
jgi:hypothetical protein